MIKQFKIGRDKNGNKTVKVICSEGSFSIQTLGNLPLTHMNGIQYYTAREIHKYVNEFGTKRQKNLVSYK